MPPTQLNLLDRLTQDTLSRDLILQLDTHLPDNQGTHLQGIQRPDLDNQVIHPLHRATQPLPQDTHQLPQVTLLKVTLLATQANHIRQLDNHIPQLYP